MIEQIQKTFDDLSRVNLRQMELSNQITANKISLEKITSKLDLLIPAAETIKQISEALSNDSLKQLELVLSNSLKVIFNRNYNIRVEVEEKYNKRNITFVILNEEGVECDLMSVGGGLVTVVSFLVQLYFIHLMKLRPVLFLDENFVFLAEEFVSNFITLIKGLCKEEGFDIILVTHRQDLAEEADQTVYLKKEGGCLVIDKILTKR